jgi:hypothetical protein
MDYEKLIEIWTPMKEKTKLTIEFSKEDSAAYVTITDKKTEKPVFQCLARTPNDLREALDRFMETSKFAWGFKDSGSNSKPKEYRDGGGY